MAAEKFSVGAVGPIDSASPAEVGCSPQAKNLGEHPTDSTSTSSSVEKGYFTQIRNHEFSRKCWTLVTWTPKRCRWDPEDPPKFSMGLNLLFGFVSISCILHHGLWTQVAVYNVSFHSVI
jgi:hypothetical protein